MRLLKFSSHDSFGLTEFAGLEVPSFAILSRTWGADSEEVTFEDLKYILLPGVTLDTKSSGSVHNKLLATDRNTSG